MREHILLMVRTICSLLIYFFINTVNSSPPIRPIKSSDARQLLMALAMPRSTSSPKAFPKFSLTVLKLSTSITNNAEQASLC